MRSWDPAVILELAREGFIFFLLTQLELGSGTLRWTDCDVDLWYDGERYEASDFTFDRVETTADLGVDSVGVTFNNASLSMGAVVLSEDIMGRPFTLSFVIAIAGSGMVLTEDQEALLLEGGLVDGEFLLKEAEATVGGYSIVGGHSLFYGQVADWKLEEPNVWLEVQNELAFWSKRTLRKCDSSCPWEFKGEECGYDGSESWCDQSYERCNALLNSDNFGGFRFLPAIAERDIWWGRSPK